MSLQDLIILNQKCEELEDKLKIAIENIEWVKSQCGYGSEPWVKMDEVLKKVREDK